MIVTYKHDSLPYDSVYIDHKNLEYFSTTRTTSRRHARWAATLAAYQYIITYRKGASNGKPDALSRRPEYSPPPLPSLPIFHTPHLLGAAVLVSPDDPLLPAIAAAQAGDATCYQVEYTMLYRMLILCKTFITRPGATPPEHLKRNIMFVYNNVNVN